MIISVRGVDVELTEGTIKMTRNWFNNNDRACIEDAIMGVTPVNDLTSYIKWRNDSIAHMEAGLSDHTFTFIQRAYYIQSGECVPLLSK